MYFLTGRAAMVAAAIKTQIMQDPKMLIPLFLLGYSLLALNPLIYYGYTNYDHVTLEQLPLEISVRLSRPDDEYHNQTKRYCPPIVLNDDDLAWQSIKHSSSFWTEDHVEFDEKAVAQSFGLMKAGGSWKPSNCNPVHNVTIVVPFRNRPSQLKKFLLHIHAFLQVQMIEYRIMVIDQVDEKPFNRAKLINVGFAESMKRYPTHCYIFHDVDLLPENIQNIYGCTQHPRHLSSAINSHRYLLGYAELFGGAVSVTRDQFRTVNGFSNTFFGWGGEDDDFFQRLKEKDLTLIRLSHTVSSYRMLPHTKQEENNDRYDTLKRAANLHVTDGLNSLSYTVVNHVEGLLYTLIQVML